MIDFLSMEIDSGYAEILLANPRIDFEHPINLSTGELFMDKYGAYCYNASLGNLKIKIRKYTSINKTKVNVSGSTHGYINHTNNASSTIRGHTNNGTATVRKTSHLK